METEYELKRGDVIRNKSTGINAIFYSYYRPADNHDTIYALLQDFETPQIAHLDFYEPTGENIDIFESLSRGEAANEKIKMAQNLMKQMQDYFGIIIRRRQTCRPLMTIMSIFLGRRKNLTA